MSSASSSSIGLAAQFKPFCEVLSTKVLECAQPDELQQLQAFFNKFDTDGDGVISRAELRNLIPWDSNTFDFFFEMLDVDGNGDISLKEAVVLANWICGSFCGSCDGCRKYINPLMDEGYRCAACQVTVDEQHDSSDLCSSCYADKSCWPAHKRGSPPGILVGLNSMLTIW